MWNSPRHAHLKVCNWLGIFVSAYDIDMPFEILANPLASAKLKQKITESLKILNEIKDKFNFQDLALSFNGGKDCLVMLHLIMHTFKTLPPTVYIRPEHPFKELDDFVNDCIKTYGMDLEVRTQDMRTAFTEYLEENKRVKAIFVGVRRSDPWASELKFIDKTTNGWPEFYRLQPVLNWEYDDVWEFIKLKNIVYCELYDRGYTSLGSVETTVPNPALKAGNTYLPAYMLSDGSLERDSRISRK